ncbi:hypothetical protein BDV40DRAFT_262908 [Aspergillus tamarii]|uniref:DUF1918 domain-containing protein n=1 Tax=Aspergillus tamarii TaxID=41984 RepID=A0A5N6UXU6_ASPTM|nr:hypothetical protein BDV40DRAFT_262908 [Aspergillus tamarii]
MKASVGDSIRLKTQRVGAEEQVAEIIAVLGADGSPPYRVRFPDGHESLIFPDPDSEIISGGSN